MTPLQCRVYQSPHQCRMFALALHVAQGGPETSKSDMAESLTLKDVRRMSKKTKGVLRWGHTTNKGDEHFLRGHHEVV